MAFVVLAAALLIGAAAPAKVEVHYAPSEDLEKIDVDLIDNAEHSIDMAAYVLSDPAIIEALSNAADRGVTIRLYLDKAQFAREGAEIEPLLAFPDVTARVKGGGPLMHLKAYAVDRVRLRTGSGNFSRSGLSAQDNDLVVVDDAEAVRRFETDFDIIFARAADPPALRAQQQASGSR